MSIYQPDILAGRRVLISGGATGICRGIALAYARLGARVAIASRRQAVLEQAAQEITAATGAELLPVPCDVRDAEAVTATVRTVVDRFGGLDTLINGAAGNFLAPASTLSPNGFRTVVDIDLCGTFNLSRAAFTDLAASGDGVIINISATLHYGATPLQIHAASAKAGVDALSQTAAAEWGPSGIRVNVIAPGPIEDTEGMRRLLRPELKDKLIASIPLRRLGRVEDVADMAVFLASKAARFITGAVFVVDGGNALRPPLAFAVGSEQ